MELYFLISSLISSSSNYYTKTCRNIFLVEFVISHSFFERYGVPQIFSSGVAHTDAPWLAINKKWTKLHISQPKVKLFQVHFHSMCSASKWKSFKNIMFKHSPRKKFLCYKYELNWSLWFFLFIAVVASSYQCIGRNVNKSGKSNVFERPLFY